MYAIRYIDTEKGKLFIRDAPTPQLNTLLVLVEYVPIPQHQYMLYMHAYTTYTSLTTSSTTTVTTSIRFQYCYPYQVFHRNIFADITTLILVVYDNYVQCLFVLQRNLF